MTDKELIQKLGGATRLCELLGFDKSSGGVQRVHNWETRGIPASIKLSRPDLFPNVIGKQSRTGSASAIRKSSDAKKRDNVIT